MLAHSVVYLGAKSGLILCAHYILTEGIVYPLGDSNHGQEPQQDRSWTEDWNPLPVIVNCVILACLHAHYILCAHIL